MTTDGDFNNAMVESLENSKELRWKITDSEALVIVIGSEKGCPTLGRGRGYFQFMLHL